MIDHGSAECPFCPMPPPYFLNELAAVIFDVNPVNRGHCLIVTKRHVAHFFDASAEERVAVFDLLDQAKHRLDEQLHPDGYNIGVNVGEAAGQTVRHLHVHLIPRYRGDIPDPRGGVRGVIPDKRHD